MVSPEKRFPKVLFIISWVLVSFFGLGFLMIIVDNEMDGSILLAMAAISFWGYMTYRCQKEINN